MLSNIKACLFDLDGTLVDSMWIWKDIDILFLKKFNLDLPESLQDEIEGMGFTEVAHYFKENFDIPWTIDEIKQCWNEMAFDYYTTKIPYKEGAKSFLTKCKEMGIQTAICTSNSRLLAEAVAKSLGFIDDIDVIITSCDVKRGKPSPDVYLEAARQLTVSPTDCLVFEDLPAGIQAGKSAGMKVCSIADNSSIHLEIEKKKLADFHIENYLELL